LSYFQSGRLQKNSIEFLKEGIKGKFKGDIDDSVSALEKYSYDASLLKVLPTVILFPKDAEDIKLIVKLVHSSLTNFTLSVLFQNLFSHKQI
jgi:hypothetical protein